MNWLLYVGGGYVVVLLATFVASQRVGQRLTLLAWAVSWTMIWAWVCWRFV